MFLRRLVFALAFVLVLGFCRVDGPTLIVGPSDEGSTVADDSAPIEFVDDFERFAPGQEADAEIVDRYPILALLAKTEGVLQIGQADFVMVDELGSPVATESAAHPGMLLKLTAWYGERQPIEFSANLGYVALDGDEVTNRQCTSLSGAFSRGPSGTYRLDSRSLPAVQGTVLAWAVPACVNTASIDLAAFFDTSVSIDVSEEGFTATNQAGGTATFRRIPAIDGSTALATSDLVYQENNQPRSVVEPGEPPPESTTSTTSVAPETTDLSQ